MKIKKILQYNSIMKPAGVVTSAAAPTAYLLTTADIFTQATIDGVDVMVVSKELASSFQGALVLLILMISIINIYKPSKVVAGSIIAGGIMLFASALLETVGLTFLLYGLGLIFNSFTIDKVVEKNKLIAAKKLDKEINAMVGG